MIQAKLYAVCDSAVRVWTDQPEDYKFLGEFRHKYNGKPARLLTSEQHLQLLKTLKDINADDSLHAFEEIAQKVEEYVHQGFFVPVREHHEHAFENIGTQWIWKLPEAAVASFEEFEHRAPGALKFVKLHTDAYVRSLIKDIEPPAHSVIQALATYSEDNKPYESIHKAFKKWEQNALTSKNNDEFVVRVLEPEEHEGQWSVECCLRDEQGTMHRVSDNVENHSMLAQAVSELSLVSKTYVPLTQWESTRDGFTFHCTLPEIEHFLSFGVPTLRQAGVIVMLPREWVKVQPKMTVKVETDFMPSSHHKLGVEHMANFTWDVALGDMKLSQKEMQDLVQQKSSLMHVRNQWVQVDQKALQAAHRYIQKNKAGFLTLGQALHAMSEAKEVNLEEPEIISDGWMGDLLKGELNQRIENIPAPEGLKAQLRHYQHDGLDWLHFMSSLGLGVILADDMGLGKTIQMLALILHERPQKLGPNLIVCPMSVVGNWEAEVKKFAPRLKVYVHHGADRLTPEELQQQVDKYDIVLTTYNILTRDVEILSKITWNRVCLDEAQYVKNHGTSQARAARRLHARHKVALTGTPVENKLMELRSIMDFVNPGIFGTRQEFMQRFAKPIERHQDQEALAHLKRFTQPFIMRRVKTDKTIAPELPQKQEITVRTNLTVEQASLYQAVVQDMLMRIDTLAPMERRALVLTTLMRLKQICNHPAHFLSDNSEVLAHDKTHRSGKLERVEDLIETILAEEQKVIIFTQYTEFGHILQPYLSEKFKTTIPFLHGGVPKKKRDEMVHNFQKSGKNAPRIMILSLKAGGTGLNLTAANHVIHVDRWWNPAVENQATDRAFRIGQEKDVQVYKLLTVGTVEERIDRIIESKKQLADIVVSSSQGWITELDTNALRELFTLDMAGVSN